MNNAQKCFSRTGDLKEHNLFISETSTLEVRSDRIECWKPLSCMCFKVALYVILMFLEIYIHIIFESIIVLEIFICLGNFTSIIFESLQA
jgi:hypothetical protein